MKKAIFEIGMLGFFVSTVIFGIQGYTLFQSISRGFIVFVGIELTAALALAASSWFATDPKTGAAPPADQTRREQPAPTRS